METPEPKVEAAAMDTPVPVIDPVPDAPGRGNGSTGSVIAILLIVLLLVVGAFYVWGQRLAEQRTRLTAPQMQ